jgi:hypothetical protein
MRSWLYRDNRPARGRRRSRPVGCMIWVIAIIIVLLVLSILFGGFHQGTKASGPVHGTSVSLALTAGRLEG